MPQFWPVEQEGGTRITPLPDVLGGDPEAQMRAVAAYIMRYNPLMADENAAKAHVNHGMAMALVIWAMILLSVLFFFKYQVPELASDRQGLDTLYYVILAITGVAFVAVQFFLGLYIWKFRHREGARGSYWHESHKMEMMWTIGTAVVLLPIVFSGLVLWNRVQAAPPDDAIVVEAVGAQFQWDFRYPGADGRFGEFRPELYSLENSLGIDPEDAASADDFFRTNQLVLPVNRVRPHPAPVQRRAARFLPPELPGEAGSRPGNVHLGHLHADRKSESTRLPAPSSAGSATTECAPFSA